jgi:predicted TIM-barrel fold metal-dependent hydrolase
MRIIDAQIHLWTNRQAPPHHARAPYTVEQALAGMDEAGVARAINCPPFWDPAAIDYAAVAAAAHPDRLATLGWFPVDAPADETAVDRLLSMPGMLGLRLLFASPATIEALMSERLEWLWDLAGAWEIPVAFGLPLMLLERVGEIAAGHPRMRVMIDHLAVSPFDKLPAAAGHFDALLALAQRPNVAIKATAVPSMASQPFPFTDTHDHLRRFFDAYGAARMFWGTDITRMQASWRQCIQLFTEELPWLRGRDLDLIMGDAVADWVRWP